MNVRLFTRASRFRVLPVMVMPVLIGAAGAFSWNGVFSLGWFLVTLAGAASMHLFSNMINDLWDYKNGVDQAAAASEGVIGTNSGVLVSGQMSRRMFVTATWSLFGFAVLCGLALAVFRGPWVLFYGIAGALLAYFYVAPPIQYGYRGKGYSEVAILFSFGVLPVLGSYYVQTLQFDVKALFSSLPVGILTTLVLFNHHFLHWQADRAAGKRTLVVVWGERKSLIASRIILALAYLSVVVAIAVRALPVYSILSLITAYRPWQLYRHLKDENPPGAYLPLMAATLKASIGTGIIITASLLASRFLP